VGVGKTTRRPPGWLGRLIEFRDGTCVYTGCERKGFAQHHHVRWWSQEGPTDLDNMVTLCHEHHQLIHEHRWTISGRPGGELRFHDPGGRPIRNRPPGIRPEIRARYFP
jgi:hypothetical protein